MGEIVPFSEALAPDVADLYVRVMQGSKKRASPRLAEYLIKVYLRNPWYTEETPALTYLEGSSVAGFVGLVPRSMLFEGKPIRVVTTSTFMVDTKLHRGGAALALLRRMMDGPQDLCFGDGSGPTVAGIWRACGGDEVPLLSFNWLRTLRPVGTLCIQTTRGASRAQKLARVALQATGFIADGILERLPPFRIIESDFSVASVGARELFECIEAISWREPLKPQYDWTSFEWLLNHISAGPTNLRSMIVKDKGDQPVGWFLYTWRPKDSAFLLQIGVRRRAQFDAVFAALLQDARCLGLACVRGRTEPKYLPNLTAHQCLFRQPSTCVLAHSRRPEILHAIHRGDATLTRLEGESWIGLVGQTWT